MKVYQKYTMVTTIKLHDSTKQELDSLKGEHQSYDDLITAMVKQRRNADLAARLKEAYTSMSAEEQEDFIAWDAFEQ